MRIGLDLDGVVYPWHDSMYRYFTTFKGYEGDEAEFWDYFRSLDKEVAEYYVGIPLHYLDTSPKESSLKYIPMLAELGEIYYITSRHTDLRPVTRKFFDNFELPFKENVIFAEDKSPYVRLLKLDYFLDDLAKHVDALLPITKAYLMQAPHNRKDREGRPTVASFKEFYKIVSGG